MRRAGGLALALALLAGLTGGAGAQQRPVESDRERQERLLRQVTQLEAVGDFAGAEALVRALLREDPGAVGVLLALERLLRLQGSEAELVEPVRAYLRADPGSAFGHHLLLRTYAAAGDLDALTEAAGRWIDADPTSETAYREVARAWESRGDLEQARAVLERGRRTIEGGDALALELGVVSARLGDTRRAIRELDRAIGEEARGLLLVRRQLGLLEGGGAVIIEPLLERLLTEPTSTERRRAAVHLAIDAGLEDVARRAAESVAPSLVVEERPRFLVEVGRRADGGALHALAYWAFARLLALEDETGRSLAVRSRLAALALAMGDTARAREHYRELERGYEEGSPERRQAAALRVELTAREGRLDDALAQLRAFRAANPGAPEADALAAVVGELLVDGGQGATAAELLAHVAGPRAALARGRLALAAGDREGALGELTQAAPGLQGAEATDAIALLSLLHRLSAEGARVVAGALGEISADQPGAAVDRLTRGAARLEDGEAAALLDFAAAAADRHGLAVRAEEARRLLIEAHPDAPEVPASLLALARAVGARPQGQLEARALLERLILEHPRSALLPQARRELDRLARRVPTS
ncbi:MAG TPA: hypothetical protein VMK65_04630 [Longimicrobiales bacterium]|nr:hypothetical protein [Longimicrobiales bacterium]